jgi:hypothetical protein
MRESTVYKAAVLGVAAVIFGACSESVTPPRNDARAAAAAEAARLHDETDGVYLVMLRPSAGSTSAAADAMLRPFALKPHRLYEESRLFTAKISAAQAARLAKDPRVLAIEPNVPIEPRDVVIQQPSPWGLDRTADPLDGSFVYTETGTGVNLYILDTPIRTTHVEFGGRVSNDYDGAGGGFDCTQAGWPYHGTAVASIAAGQTDGVAKGVPIHSVMIFNCATSGTLATMVNGLVWVANHHLAHAVANMSAGVGCSGGTNPPPGGTQPKTGGVCEGTSSTVDAAIAQLVNSGVTLVVAAGNSNTPACNNTPGKDTQAIIVGAVDSTLTRWVASPYGSDYGSCVTMFAPGVNIATASSTGDNDMTVYMGGATSLAAPFVTGTAVLYVQKYPFSTPAQVKAALVAAAKSNELSNIGSGSPNKMVNYAFTPIAVSMSGPSNADHETVTITATPGQGGSLWFDWTYQYCGTYPGPKNCAGMIYHGTAGVGANVQQLYVAGDKWVRFTATVSYPSNSPILGKGVFDVGGPLQ